MNESELRLQIVLEPGVQVGKAAVGNPQAPEFTVIFSPCRAVSPPVAPVLFPADRPAERVLQVLANRRREDLLVVYILLLEIKLKLHLPILEELQLRGVEVFLQVVLDVLLINARCPGSGFFPRFALRMAVGKRQE